jgi:PAS domain S-box-containing protein
MSQSPPRSETATPFSNMPEAGSPSAGTPKLASSSRPGPSPSLVRALANSVDDLLTGKASCRSASADEARDLLAPPFSRSISVEILFEILDQSPDAILVLSGLDGHIEFCNQTAAAWMKEDREALLGRKFTTMFPEEQTDAAAYLLQESNRCDGTTLSIALTASDSSQRYVEFRSAVITNEEGSWILLSGRELAPGALDSEATARAERDRLRALVHSLRDGLVVLSKKGDILFANPAVEEMFGTENLSQICHEWLRDFATYDQAGILGFSSPYEGQVLELPANDGRTFLVTRSFLFERSGTASVMLIAKDITELKLLQQKGHQLEMELLRESKLAEFGALAAGIAHNLNGPLTSILGSCDLVRLTTGMTADIERIHAQGVAMKDIIETLMRKSRQEQNLEPQEISVNELIETEWKFLHANLFFKHDVEKCLELDEMIPKIHAVYSDLSQAIGNLLRNAIDALQTSEEKRLVVRTRHNDRFLFVEIEDSGVGIKPEDMPKLFRPFFTTKPMPGKAAGDQPTGTGLGLATSRSLLARYGAEILVDSTWMEGSTFTIRFPISHPPATK